MQTWVVCERSGRWSGALRRLIVDDSQARFMPRVYEVQSLAEAAAYTSEHSGSLGLVEVGRDNLAVVLELLANDGSGWAARFVALLGYSIDRPQSIFQYPRGSGTTLIAEVLREAGALDVLESPRQLGRVMNFGERLAAIAQRTGIERLEGQSIAEFAWTMLPWQDE